MKDKDQTSPNHFEISYMIPLPFPVVDASLDDIFAAMSTTSRIRRVGVTSGSARYDITVNDGQPGMQTVDLSIRIIEDRSTLISTKGRFTDNFALAIITFIESLIDDITQRQTKLLQYSDQGAIRVASLSSTTTFGDALQGLASVPMPHKRGIHHSYEEDDWAWSEVNIKDRPRLEVRAEWMERLSPGRELQDKPGSFRHAVSPKRKPKRKAET